MGRLLESAAGRAFSIGEVPGMKRVAAVLLMAAACRAGPAPLRLGTTYTVQQSGALAVLESLWTGPAPLTTVVAPSGQILRAAANGDLDVVITHAPALEQRLLLRPGHALLRCPLAASRFAVVGPAADPARVATAATAAEAFRRIAGAGGARGGRRGPAGGGERKRPKHRPPLNFSSRFFFVKKKKQQEPTAQLHNDCDT